MMLSETSKALLKEAKEIVLILVLVDDALWVQGKLGDEDDADGLNPYFSGWCSLSTYNMPNAPKPDRS